MLKITEKEYKALHRDYRNVWTVERDDWRDWAQVREQYMGKRTMMKENALWVEGLDFEIISG